jgi:uncharacterized protein (TIGR04222 family)
MYLAATADVMVSPSEIVDTVWHQHLIYTQSYKEFCRILQKEIAHIPSNHNPKEKERFVKAKQTTQNYYEQEFGKQPPEFWKYQDFNAALQLPPAKIHSDTISRATWVLFIVFFIPFAFLAAPILKMIENPYFLIGYISCFIISVISLNIFLLTINGKLYDFKNSNFILKNLTWYEVAYLEHDNLSSFIHILTNELVEDKHIEVLEDYKLRLLDDTPTIDKYKNAILRTLQANEPMYYPQLLKEVTNKPLFLKTSTTLTNLSVQIKNSQLTISSSLAIHVAFLLFLLVGVSRLLVGFFNGKDVLFLFFTLIALLVSYVLILFFLEKKFSKRLSSVYQYPSKSEKILEEDKWKAIFSNELVYYSSFAPVVAYANRHSHNTTNSYGSSCGSSCGSSDGGGGSSCGGGCGGCGGGD